MRFGGRYSAVLLLLVVTAACARSNQEPSRVLPQPKLSQEQQAAAYAACLTDHGFLARVEPEDSLNAGAIRFHAPPEQFEAFEAARDQCENEIVGDVPVQDLSRAEWEAIYQGHGDVADCLVQQGYTGNAPSLEVFIEQGGSWSPYEWVPVNVTPDEWRRLNRSCPQFGD